LKLLAKQVAHLPFKAIANSRTLGNRNTNDNSYTRTDHFRRCSSKNKEVIRKPASLFQNPGNVFAPAQPLLAGEHANC
jgi:hypothetical protein